MFTPEERKMIEAAGEATFAMAVELRKLCNLKTIRPANLAKAVDQLAIAMGNMEALVALCKKESAL